ncbi:hypothetical protein COCMIDRAFT_90059 [Bipolaris oryzae ATCC 44560]|uniref:Uncharacterized protein n=1 Tax=Bipolaris oryzae ATCC 44560 TaxID=930090 RepID=W6ZJ47_COCMI|nr:uncharacterized protein COCMIDRAFT_90059 [Bipolaris oryzae ATCC 44560]EUC47479.1 hypothetical protein COCMIDRAFT_90059 [Bipolaris oryzae ATCC 44560]
MSIASERRSENLIPLFLRDRLAGTQPRSICHLDGRRCANAAVLGHQSVDLSIART